MVGHLASPKPLHMARWGGKGALMGCTRRTAGPTRTLPLSTADQTHTHTQAAERTNKGPNIKGTDKGMNKQKNEQRNEQRNNQSNGGRNEQTKT